MVKIAVLAAVVCLLAGCATQSLTVSADGAVELTVKAADLGKAYTVATSTYPKIETICKNGLEMPGYRSEKALKGVSVLDVVKIPGVLRDFINAQTLTLKGRCLGRER